MDTLRKRIRKPSDMECIKSCYLAEGTKSILDGNTNDARIEATITKLLEGLITDQKNGYANSQAGSPAKMAELYLADEHTLVQFFRKRISCSCLDEKYKEVKSITKMGRCWNEKCPLPDRRAVRSEMVCCSRCHQENYC